MSNYPSDPGTEARYLSLLITHHDYIIPLVEPAAIYEPLHKRVYCVLRRALPVMHIGPLLSHLLDVGRARYPQFAYHLAGIINSGGRLIHAPLYLSRLRSVRQARAAGVRVQRLVDRCYRRGW